MLFWLGFFIGFIMGIIVLIAYACVSISSMESEIERQIIDAEKRKRKEEEGEGF